MITSRSNQPAARRPMGGPMGHGPMGMGKGEKPRDFKGTLHKLVHYLRKYRLLILVVWLFAIASTISAIIGPKILGQATTKLFEGVMAQIAGSGSIDFNAIGRILITVLLLYTLSSLFSFVQGWIMSNVAMNITYRFRQDISQKSTACRSDILTAPTMARFFPGLPMTWIRSVRLSTRA